MQIIRYLPMSTPIMVMLATHNLSKHPILLFPILISILTMQNKLTHKFMSCMNTSLTITTNIISFNTVDYQWTIQDHDLSLLITITTNGTDVPVNQYYTYNINTQDGNQFSFNKALELTGIESSDQLIQDAITSKLHDFYNGEDFFNLPRKKF